MLENEIRRKLEIFEEIGRADPGGAKWIKMMSDIVQSALASHSLATLKQIERELDTMAEEAFVRPSLGKYRDRYWGINGPSLVEKEVRTALLQGYIRDEDQARSIQTYLDQIATGFARKLSRRCRDGATQRLVFRIPAT